MFCPLIKDKCKRENCTFWQGFYNKDKKIDYDCSLKWQNILIIELLNLIRKIERGINNDRKE
ncbi:hypothetical protein ES708_20592 [subsurface metagenome]